MAERSHPRKRLRPGRVITRVVIFLLLGAIVNVAVAWVCANWTPVEFERVWMSDVPEPYIRWFEAKSEAVGVGRWPSPHGGSEASGFGYSVIVLRAGDDDPDEKPFHGISVVNYRAGWPRRSLSMSHWHERRYALNGAVKRSYESDGFIAVRSRLGDANLPYRPIWPGFAMNTVFYAIVLWLLILAGPRTLGRHLRRRRGRCVKCNYDLRGAKHEHCPECGAVV